MDRRQAAGLVAVIVLVAVGGLWAAGATSSRPSPAGVEFVEEPSPTAQGRLPGSPDAGGAAAGVRGAVLLRGDRDACEQARADGLTTPCFEWFRTLPPDTERPLTLAAGRGLALVGSTGQVMALDREDGTARWSTDLRGGNAVVLPPREGTVPVTFSNRVGARILDALTGEVRWADDADLIRIAPVRDGLAASTREGLTLMSSSGASELEVGLGGFPSAVQGIGGSLVMIVDGDLLRVDSSGGTLWRTSLRYLEANASSMAVSQGVVVVAYKGGGRGTLPHQLSGFSAANGELLWRRDVGPVRSLTVTDRPEVIATLPSGVLGIDPTSGETVWRHGTDAVPIHVEAEGGRVLVVAGGTVTALATRSGVPLWSILPEGDPLTTSRSHDGRVLVLTSSGVLAIREATDEGSG